MRLDALVHPLRAGYDCLPSPQILPKGIRIILDLYHFLIICFDEQKGVIPPRALEKLHIPSDMMVCTGPRGHVYEGHLNLYLNRFVVGNGPLMMAIDVASHHCGDQVKATYRTSGMVISKIPCGMTG